MLICRQVSGDELQSLSVRIKFQLPSLPSYSFCTATNGVTQEAAYLQSDVGKLPDDCNCIIIRQRYFNATLLRTVLSQQKLPRVEYLILYENIEEGVEKILEAALYLEHLRVLIIQGVELKLLEQDALASILHKHRIMDLVLHRNRFNGNGRLDCLLSVLLKKNCLQSLRLTRNDLKSPSSGSLSKFIENTTTLQKIDLSGNLLGSVGVSMISRGIRANWSITALSLNYCSMQCVGASTLARCLSGNQCICKLELAGNQIGPAGGRAIFETISSLAALTHLNLHNNNLRDEGMHHLFVYFPRWCLSFLDVSMNQISPVTDRELTNLFFAGKHSRDDVDRSHFHPGKLVYMLAILMARHPRLGCGSALIELHDDLFRMILDDYVSSLNAFSAIF